MDKHKKQMIQTLIKGRTSTLRLQNLLHEKVNIDGSVSVDDLMSQVMGSFSTVLSVLNSRNPNELQVAQVSTSAVRQRRGCYKRRRKTTDSWFKISDTSEDGYTWRKYGQKEILSTKFPRCYFRCTHKHVHGCKALKYVQKLDDESNLFHITYFGHHSCPPPNSFPHPGLVLDCKDSENHHKLPSKPSIITNADLDPPQKQEDLCDHHVSLPSDAQSSIALVWKDILINDLESFNDCSF